MATHPHDMLDRVKAICNDLYRQGIKPSVRLVLAQMPDVKSTSTIHKHYAEWRRELDSNEKSLYDRLGFSSEFSQAFMKEITRFSVEAETRYKDMAADAEEQRAIVIEDLTRADDRLYKQTAVVEQLEKDLVQVKAELADAAKAASATLVELRKQLDELKEENKQLAITNEGLRTEIAKAQLLVDGNERYVQEVKVNHQALVQDLKNLTAQHAETLRQLAHQEAENSGYRQLISQLRSAELEFKGQLEKRETDVHSLQSDLRVARADIDTHHRLAIEANAKLAEQHKRNDDLQRVNAEQASVIKTFTTTKK